MSDKGIQVAVGLKRPRSCSQATQRPSTETSESGSQKIGREGKIVQINESKFGKREYHQGHHVEGQWVFGGIEQESRKCFVVAVDKRDKGTLLPLIERWIEPGTVIIFDCW